MKLPIHDCRGTTLVELIAGMAVAGILCAACAALLGPALRLFLANRQQLRAQAAMDNLMDALRADLSAATGTIRFADAAQEGAVFRENEGNEGTAVEFLTADGIYVIVDAGPLPQTLVPPSLVEARPAGTVHRRFFIAQGESPRYQYRDPGGGYRADGCNVLFAPEVYLPGATVALSFSVWGSRPEQDGLRVTSLLVTADLLAQGQSLCHRQAILDLPDEPFLLDAAP